MFESFHKRNRYRCIVCLVAEITTGRRVVPIESAIVLRDRLPDGRSRPGTQIAAGFGAGEPLDAAVRRVGVVFGQATLDEQVNDPFDPSLLMPHPAAARLRLEPLPPEGHRAVVGVGLSIVR